MRVKAPATSVWSVYTRVGACDIPQRQRRTTAAIRRGRPGGARQPARGRDRSGQSDRTPVSQVGSSHPGIRRPARPRAAVGAKSPRAICGAASARTSSRVTFACAGPGCRPPDPPASDLRPVSSGVWTAERTARAAPSSHTLPRVPQPTPPRQALCPRSDGRPASAPPRPPPLGPRRVRAPEAKRLWASAPWQCPPARSPPPRRPPPAGPSRAGVG